MRNTHRLVHLADVRLLLTPCRLSDSESKYGHVNATPTCIELSEASVGCLIDEVYASGR